MAKKPAGKTSPIVLLHGMGGSQADWKDAAKALTGLTPYAFDLPGAGGEARTSSTFDPPSLARFVLAKMDAEGLQTAALAGHSIGARVAGEVAALAPGRVTGLVLVGPVGAVPYGFTDKLKWKAMSRKSVLSSVPESSMRNAASYGFEGEGAGKKGFVARALASRTGKDASFVTTAVERMVDGVLDAPALSERLKGTKTPLLVLVGEKDPLSPPGDARKLLGSRPDAHFVELRGLGHYPQIEDPERVAKEISGFMK